MELELERIAYLDKCTIGRIGGPLLIGGPIYTIERPWLPNPAGRGGVPRQSCIPDGRYVVRRHESMNFPGTYALTNEELGVYYQQKPDGQLWGRTAILMHKANQVTDVIGCVGLGLRYVIYSDTVTLLRSREALDVLRAAFGHTERHTLVIRPARGAVDLPT